jgi:hypothetical protein
MARVKYREHLQMIPAVQNKGNNLAELEEFAPGRIVVEDGNIFVTVPPSDLKLPVNTTDWLIDDPTISYIIPITDAAFQCRFDAAPIP